MVGSLSAGLLLADEAGAHLPSVDDFLPPEILFQGTPFAINRIILIRIVATIVLLVVLGVTAKRAKLIPGRWQGVVEYGLDFVRDKVVYDVMGEARGKRYVPMITTLFFTIFIFNLCGIIPGMNMAANATVVMPLVFAVWTLIQYWIAAIRSQGLGHYLRHELFTPGVPWPVYFLLAPINLLELLIIRPASLTIRLFANMVSGHLMVATCLAFETHGDGADGTGHWVRIGTLKADTVQNGVIPDRLHHPGRHEILRVESFDGDVKAVQSFLNEHDAGYIAEVTPEQPIIVEALGNKACVYVTKIVQCELGDILRLLETK
jgi:F-type H+-transporting ATPase subunit a